MRRFLYSVVPPFAMFGPIMIAQSIPGLALWQTLFVSVGALMSGSAVLAVWLRQQELDRERGGKRR